MSTYPGTIGQREKPHSFLMLWRSVWHIPQYNTFNLTSSSAVSLYVFYISIFMIISSACTVTKIYLNLKQHHIYIIFLLLIINYLLEKLNGERWPEQSRAAHPKAFIGCSSSGDFDISMRELQYQCFKCDKSICFCSCFI